MPRSPRSTRAPTRFRGSSSPGSCCADRAAAGAATVLCAAAWFRGRAASIVPGVNGLSDSIAWPSRDPQWVSKVLLTGLILLIPIVGQMVVLGWMLAAVDNLRAGRQELPPAGFSHIGRGVPLFVVYLVYGLAIAVVFAALLAAGILITVAA